MHMADALISPAVGGALWAASAATLVWCSRRVRSGDQEQLVPLMGVLGAFVFAAQMINFTIPATGSSGHLGGGLLLAILLGPHAAFVVIASVLTVQALFFADGGLLALGANIFNLGAIPCFIGTLLVYRPVLGADASTASSRRLGLATVLAALVGLQLGALGVVIETHLAGIASLPLTEFLLLMLPIHLAIGLVEGLATAAVVLFLRQARPDLFAAKLAGAPSVRPILLALGLAAALTAGVVSWFASTAPDGLEWSIAHLTGSEKLAPPASGVHVALAGAQQTTAWLPDYKLPAAASTHGAAVDAAWPAADASASIAGIIGAAMTLALVAAVGYLLRRRRSAP